MNVNGSPEPLNCSEKLEYLKFEDKPEHRVRSKVVAQTADGHG